MEELQNQIGGSHYKDMEYQPIELINRLRLGFVQGNIVKYVSRYRRKNGLQDLEKAIHYCKIAEESGLKERNPFWSRPWVYANGEIADYCDKNELDDDFVDIIVSVCKNDWRNAYKTILLKSYEEYGGIFYNGQEFEKI